MRQTKQRIERLERRITKKATLPPRMNSGRNSMQGWTDEDSAIEQQVIEWYYEQLTAPERHDHDAIIAEISTDASPSATRNTEFDVIQPSTGEIPAMKQHLSGCTCFDCIQRRDFYRDIGLLPKSRSI
jgi:hypothetical protein